MVNSNKLKEGFTLIELLVVISVTSLMSSVILVTTTQARLKAFDAKRMSDINNIYNALMFYVDAHEGSYPLINAPTLFDPYLGSYIVSSSTNSDYSQPGFPGWSELETALGIQIPEDPANDSNHQYSYMLFF